MKIQTAARVGLGLLLVVASVSAWASRDVSEQVQYSMLVSGQVVIETDGTVASLTLDQPEKLPQGVRELVQISGQRWRFEPVKVDGAVRRATTRMSVRVVARHPDSPDDSMRLQGAQFGPVDSGQLTHRQRLHAHQQSIPQYPLVMLAHSISATTYVILKVGPKGQVQDAFAEKVNLHAAASPARVAQARMHFGRSAVNAARKWTFEVPADGPRAAESHWVVRVPVEYAINGQRVPGYGQWQVYLPGPRYTRPWMYSGNDDDSDAAMAGTIQQVNDGVRLKSPLQSS